MKNTVYNSSLNAYNGNIQIGDTVIVNLENVKYYPDILEKIKKLEQERANVELKHSNILKKIEKNSIDEDVIDFKFFLETRLVDLQDEISDLKKQSQDFVDNFLIAFNICIKDKKNSDKLPEIENLLRLGKIDLVNERLNVETIINRRDTYKKTLANIELSMLEVSKELLLKATTIQLQLDNPNRLPEAYFCYKESLNTYTTKENSLEFIKFLNQYKQEESIGIYKILIEKYSHTMPAIELANAYSDLAFSERLNRSLNDSLISTKHALEIYEKLDNQLIIKKIDLLIKIITCYRELAITYSQKDEFDKAQKHYDLAFAKYKTINNTKGVYMKDYGELLLDYSQFLHVKRTPQSTKESLPYAKDAVSIFNNMLNINNNEDVMSLATAICNLGRIQLFFGPSEIEYSYVNLKYAENLIIKTQDIHESSTIGILSMIQYELSLYYDRKGNLEKAITCLHNCINLLKMRFNVSTQESKELAAVFSICLSDYEIKRKNYEQYIKHRMEALQYYLDIHQLNPERSFIHILGSYQKLILKHLNCENQEVAKKYLRKLIKLFEICRLHNPDIEVIKLYIGEVKNIIATFYRYCDNDENKAKEAFVEVINEIGIDNANNEHVNMVVNYSTQMLLEMNVNEITINKKKYNIKIPPI